MMRMSNNDELPYAVVHETRRRKPLVLARFRYKKHVIQFARAHRERIEVGWVCVYHGGRQIFDRWGPVGPVTIEGKPARDGVRRGHQRQEPLRRVAASEVA
jgi:hypothetical protein